MMHSLGSAGFGTCDVIGTGPDVLLLPSLSSISTRREMHPLAEQLGDLVRCVIPDWLGFGARPRERVALSTEALRDFLDGLLREAVATPAIGIGAGHGAIYLVDAARRHSGRFSQLILISPTWRGPLPTMFGGRRPSFGRKVRRAIELPVLGHLLYRLNLSAPVVARMMRAHVYADARHVTPALLAEKHAVARQPRARFGTAAFISGGLDLVASRDAFLSLFEGDLPPITMLQPEHAPPRSGAEMEALAETGRVVVKKIPGALAAYEEYPAEVAAAIRSVLISSAVVRTFSNRAPGRSSRQRPSDK